MSKFTIEIDTSGDAFSEDNAGSELARLLRLAADKVEADRRMSATLYDYNGNDVGRLEFEDDDPDCPFTFAHTRHWCGYRGCRDA